jgi:hypothetical protein
LQAGIPPAAVAAAAALDLPAVPLSFTHRPQLYDINGRLMLKNLTQEELEEWCESVGEQLQSFLRLLFTDIAPPAQSSNHQS